MVSVSSAFVEQTRRKTNTGITRQFTIAGSDYSDHILEWPRLRRRWDEIKPTTVRTKLANQDKAFNIFQQDKTLMKGEAIFKYIGETIAPADPGFSVSYAELLHVEGSSVNSAGYFDISAEDQTPTGIDINSEGNIAWVMGDFGSTIYQYDSVDGDVRSMSYTGSNYNTLGPSIAMAVSPDGDNVLAASVDRIYSSAVNSSWLVTSVNSFNFSVSLQTSAQSNRIRGMDVDWENEKLYIVGSDSVVYQYALNVSNPSLSVYEQSKNVVTEVSCGSRIRGLTIDRPGGKMLIGDWGTERLYQYSLDANTNISSATYDSTFLDVSSPMDLQYGGHFGRHGKPEVLYVADLDNNNEGFFQFNGPDAETSSLSIVTSGNLSSAISPIKSRIKPDGTYLYAMRRNSGVVYEFFMDPAFDANTCSYTGNSISLGTSNVTAFDIHPDGTHMYTITSDEHVMRHELEVAAWDISSHTTVNSFDIGVMGGEISNVNDIFWDRVTGDRLFLMDTTDDAIYQYDANSSFLSESVNSWTAVYSMGGNAFGADFNNDGTELWMLDADEVLRVTRVNSAYDLSSASIASTYNKDVGGDLTVTAFGGGVTIANSNTNVFVTVESPDTVYKYSLYTPESTQDEIEMFAGTIKSIGYKSEICTMNIVDKFQQLSDRLVGTSDIPADFTTSNYLPSDIAWDCITSYGGMDSTQSTANTDIDWTSFQEWAAVFSGDTVYMQASFDGQKVTEVLRKIAHQTHSAIFVSDDKVTFKRFGIADANVTSLGGDILYDVELDFRLDDIINRQVVAGDFVVGSTHQFSIVQANSTSVNSFGAKEDQIEDENLWYVTSLSAINLAQRRLYSNADPDDRLKAKTGMVGLPRTIGETVTIIDDFHSISESYRILEYEFDMDKTEATFGADRTQVTGQFILDTSSLGSTTDVLT